MFPSPFLKHEGDIDTSDIHLAAMGMQPEEPAVENVTGPITELRLDKPVTELLCLVPGRRGVPRVEKEIHTHLCVKVHLRPMENSKERLGVFKHRRPDCSSRQPFERRHQPNKAKTPEEKTVSSYCYSLFRYFIL